MIRQSQADYDYILTDMKGVIDSFSARVSTLLNMPSSIFKESDINIQILAPDLIKVFSSQDKRRPLLEKFKEAGGQKLQFVVPKEFSIQSQNDKAKKEAKRKEEKKSEKKEETKKEGKKGDKKAEKKEEKKLVKKKTKTDKQRSKDLTYRELNKDMNKHNGIANKPISPRSLLQTPEYKDSDNRHPVKCEIQDPVYGEVYKNFDALKLRVFKLYGINIKQTGTHIDQGSEPGSHHYNGMAHSNASFEWKDSKGASDVDMKKSESKDVLNFMLGGQNTFSKGPDGKEEKKEEPVGGREDTKTTERLPGNVMTTEGRVETIESKPVLKMTFSPNSKTGEVKKKVSTSQSRQSLEGEKKQEGVDDLSMRRDSVISLCGPSNVGQTSKESLRNNLSVVVEAKSEDSKIPQKDGASSTGKSLDKTPKSVQDSSGRGRGGNAGKEESGYESESKKSTGRVNLGVPGANIKEEEKKKPKSGFKKHVSTGKLFEKEKKEEEEAANPKTLIEEVVNRRINDPPKKDDDINPSDFNESNIVGDKSEDQKEESEEFKEKVVPLNQINMELKIAQAEKPNIKVPSMLDDIVGGLTEKSYN